MSSIENFIEKFNKKCWQEIYKRLFGGVVFIEDSCAECLHWDGGLSNLIDSGAVGVKNLSFFECGNENQKKCVFICIGNATNLDTIKEILKNSYFVNIILVLTADSNVLFHECDINYADLERNINDWNPKKPCVAEIVYSPIFTVSLTSNIFVAPIFNTLYPKFDEELTPPSLTTLDLYSLSLEDKNEVRRLAVSFNSLLEYLDSKEDIFYMGPFSSIIAGVLEHLPEAVSRRKNASKQTSIIFIDRTIDLAGVTTHNSVSLLDKMMNLLPRFPGHVVDLAVDISNLCEADMVSVIEDLHLNPGCIIHPNDENCRQTIDRLVNKTQPEVLFGLYDKLSKIANTTPCKLPTRVTAQNLEKIVSSCKGNYDLIEANAGLLQQTLSVVQTLKSSEMQQIELLTCLEIQVLQSLTTSKDSTSVLSQISNIIKSWKQRGLSLERILALLIYVYSIAGAYVTFSETQEKNLHDALSIALFEDHTMLKNEDKRLQSPEAISSFAEMLIKRLNDISKIRDSMIKYKSVIKVLDSASPGEYKGVLQQLVCDLVDERRPEIPDLKCRTGGLKDFLKSGLSMLMNTTTKSAQNISKHPFDNPTVIIFIVGGMTIEECFKMNRTIMMSGSDVNVVIGSTALVNPIEAMKQAL